MKIKFLRGTFHLGYAYRAGDTASLPDEVANKLIEGKYAVPQAERKRPEPKKAQAPTVTRTKKRPVKK